MILKNDMIKIAPSMLSADFGNLLAEIKEIEEAGAEILHIDVMDGHFVPPVSFGPMVFKSIRPHVGLMFDCHLLVENPEKYIDAVIDAGADYISVHFEATNDVHNVIRQIKDKGKRAGLVINPETPVSDIEEVLEELDMVLVMSVNPGFGGQVFLENTPSKIRQLVNLREENGYLFEIEVDGGINSETAKLCIEAGVDILVAGSYIFDHKDKATRINSLR